MSAPWPTGIKKTLDKVIDTDLWPKRSEVELLAH